MNLSPTGILHLSPRRQRGWPALVVFLLSFGLAGVDARRAEAQSVRWEAHKQILEMQASFNQFRQTQAEAEEYRERERLRVPVYSSDLSKIVADFRKHTADMHFRHVTCKICKSQVKELRKLSKRIESAMK